MSIKKLSIGAHHISQVHLSLGIAALHLKNGDDECDKNIDLIAQYHFNKYEEMTGCKTADALKPSKDFTNNFQKIIDDALKLKGDTDDK